MLVLNVRITVGTSRSLTTLLLIGNSGGVSATHQLRDRETERQREQIEIFLWDNCIIDPCTYTILVRTIHITFWTQHTFPPPPQPVKKNTSAKNFHNIQ